jgi:tetratricopeptide (TPR) repeat protein
MVVIKKRYSPVGFGILAFLASYFVISNWVFKVGTIMGERLMYMPSFGIAVLIGYLVSELMERVGWPKLIWYTLGTVVGLFFVVQIFSGNKLWLNERNLLENAYRHAPASVVNQTNRAYLALVDGKYSEANQQIEAVLKMVPNHVPALNLAGQIAKKLGKLSQAEAYWKKVIELRSDYIKAYLSLGVLYYENGYFKSGEYILSKAVAIYPRWNEVAILSLTETALGKYDEAISIIASHFGFESSERQLRFALGVAYLKKGDEVRARHYLVPLRDPAVSEEAFLSKIRGGQSFYLGDL